MSADPAAGVGLFAALWAGVVSFLSPCVLPLVPGYLSAVTGVSVTELEDAGWRRVLVPSLLFVASFSAIFILLGLTATGLGSTLNEHRGAAREDRRGADHRHGRGLRRRTLRPDAEPRVARRLADEPRRQGRPGDRRRSPSGSPGPPASARPSGRSSPPRRSPTRPAGAPSCSPSTRPASRSRSCSPRSPSRG